MVQKFTDITDRRILSYSAQILINVVEAEFTDQQEQKFLEMHGFNPELISEIQDLGTKMNKRFSEFQLAIQNSLYSMKVQEINEEVKEQEEAMQSKDKKKQSEQQDKMEIEEQAQP